MESHALNWTFCYSAKYFYIFPLRSYLPKNTHFNRLTKDLQQLNSYSGICLPLPISVVIPSCGRSGY